MRSRYGGSWTPWVEFLHSGNWSSYITLPTVNNGTLTLSTGSGLTGSATFTANQSGNSTFTVSPTFGTTAGTIAQGDDSRINNGQTAFSWGNHNNRYHRLASNLTDATTSSFYGIVLNLDANDVKGNVSVYPSTGSTNVIPNSHLTSFGVNNNYSWQMNKNSGNIVLS